MVEERNNNSGKGPTIPQLFENKKVLITGATGFVGKVLVEKLLRSCPGISEIIILIRSYTETERNEKLSKMLKYQVFNRVKEECPTALEKLRPIHGEIAWKNMGIDASILESLCNEVSFVFHCAASVRFDSDPEYTLKVNLKGVKKLLKLCKRMSRLEALVHVSTAFSFCNQPIIGEEIYLERVGPNTVLDALKWMRPVQLKKFTEYLIEGRPSLYHASKAMAEILISEQRENLPVIIVRPSIITASRKEPFPGWIDNYNGPSGFIALSSKGMLKTLLVNKNINADWIPVDVVANTLIVAAHYMALQGKSHLSHPLDTSKVPIVNCVCPPGNQIEWSSVVDMTIPLLLQYPSSTVCIMPGGIVTSSRPLHTMCKYLFHYLPAYVLDTVCLAVWKDLGLVNMYTKIHSVLNHLQLYTTHPFMFTSRNMVRLIRTMNDEDMQNFPISLVHFDWSRYMQDYVLGVRRYFLKENDDSLTAARKRVKILQIVHYSLIVLLSGTASYWIAKGFGNQRFDIRHATNQLIQSFRNRVPTISYLKSS